MDERARRLARRRVHPLPPAYDRLVVAEVVGDDRETGVGGRRVAAADDNGARVEKKDKNRDRQQQRPDPRSRALRRVREEGGRGGGRAQRDQRGAMSSLGPLGKHLSVVIPTLRGLSHSLLFSGS